MKAATKARTCLALSVVNIDWLEEQLRNDRSIKSRSSYVDRLLTERRAKVESSLLTRYDIKIVAALSSGGLPGLKLARKLGVKPCLLEKRLIGSEWSKSLNKLIRQGAIEKRGDIYYLVKD